MQHWISFLLLLQLSYMFYIFYRGSIIKRITVLDLNYTYAGNGRDIFVRLNNSLHKALVNTNLRKFKILFYQKPVWVEKENPFPIKNCAFDNCELIFNKSLISDSDVVVFDHGVEQNQPKKLKHQIWAFHSFENIHFTHKYFRKAHWVNAFDWTISYRKDSEGYGPYGKIITRDEIKNKDYADIFRKKTKTVAWFVSNCHAPSRRDQYVSEMKKYIDIDVFGKCGENKCRQGDCKQRILKDYKFYLAFENALCYEYSTEKVFQIYANEDWNIIPVVRGDPNIRNVLPYNTYISTLDFKSPKDLAFYLKTVAANETLFSKILSMKDKFTIPNNPADHYLKGMCSLCGSLNKYGVRKTRLNLKQWFLNKCITPTDI